MESRTFCIILPSDDGKSKGSKSDGQKSRKVHENNDEYDVNDWVLVIPLTLE